MAAGSAKYLLRSSGSLFGFFLTVDHFGQFVGQNFLGTVQLAALPVVHLINLLQRQESQHPNALQHILISYISPILVKLKGTGLIGIQPNSSAGGFTHLFPLTVQQQSDRHGIGIFAQLFTDQFRAAQHIAPLVITAELHIAAVVLEQVIEIVALHDHVVEFQERESLFHPLLVTFGAQHIIHRKTGADLSQQIDIFQF